VDVLLFVFLYFFFFFFFFFFFSSFSSFASCFLSWFVADGRLVCRVSVRSFASGGSAELEWDADVREATDVWTAQYHLKAQILMTEVYVSPLPCFCVLFFCFFFFFLFFFFFVFF
jgi:hypothetical protein